METIFISTQNSNTDESSKFLYEFTDKSNLKNPNKNMVLANLSIYIHGKTLNLNITTITLRLLLQLGMIHLIYLMGHILFLIYKTILNISLKI